MKITGTKVEFDLKDLIEADIIAGVKVAAGLLEMQSEQVRQLRRALEEGSVWLDRRDKKLEACWELVKRDPFGDSDAVTQEELRKAMEG